ncbi:MAG: OsmC family protein [Gemmatimonadales bacterium]
MGKLNNVNVQAVEAFAAEVERDASIGKKLKKVVGRWVFEEGKPQFTADLEYPGGTQTTETDFAPFMGGQGVRPDPVTYCLYGFASCFAGTFAAVASAEGIKLEKLEVTLENEVDLSRSVGVSDRPVTQGMSATLRVESDATREKLEEVRRLAEERCPGVYCVTNPIPFSSRVEG